MKIYLVLLLVIATSGCAPLSPAESTSVHQASEKLPGHSSSATTYSDSKPANSGSVEFISVHQASEKLPRHSPPATTNSDSKPADSGAVEFISVNQASEKLPGHSAPATTYSVAKPADSGSVAFTSVHQASEKLPGHSVNATTTYSESTPTDWSAFLTGLSKVLKVTSEAIQDYRIQKLENQPPRRSWE